MIKALKPYSVYIGLLVLLAFAANGLSLLFPKKVGEFVDANRNIGHTVYVLGGLTLIILVAAILQFVISSYVSEKAGRDIRNQLISALKNRSFSYIRDTTSSHLITVMTSDVDAVKNLVASGIVSLLSAGVTLVGAIVFLLFINWKLGLATLSVVPLIMIVMFLVFGKIGKLFGLAQENLDTINKTINESIIASPLVRVLSAEQFELNKFEIVNRKGTDISRTIVTYFSALIPVIMFLSNIAILVVLYFGGIQVIHGGLTLGQMSAFFSYTAVFVWPFFVLSFAGTFISRAQVSLKRINAVLDGDKAQASGTLLSETPKHSKTQVEGHILFKDVTLRYGEKIILKDISFEIQPHTRTAIVGPTGAGKTELFYLLAGLATPTHGEITIDGEKIDSWDMSALLSHIGMVFQDSIMFNTSLRENILFNSKADSTLLDKAILTADLEGLVESLPQGLETNVSERGTTLSGGQKQRVMLARALVLNPSILLLDDFTSRVDAGTEERIIQNIKVNFPDITLISITQKVEPIKTYEKVIVLMEGELIADGRHPDLLATSLEYQQIFESQQSTETEGI